MALGETLKNARIQKGLSLSDVAESTHMMVQVVGDLEREDFRRIAAPIYGRGFVRLYAELLELDSEPLIRDFMDLYAGARAPSVRTKSVEAQAESLSERGPHDARGVSAPVSPQRQPVQPRPAVRPLSVPQAAVRGEEAPAAPAVRVEKPAEDAATVAPVTVTPENEVDFQAEDRVGLVVDPEDTSAESDEPDLFRPQPARRKPVAGEAALSETPEEEGPRRTARKSKLPVFKIGGRLQPDHAPEAHDGAAHERRLARIKKFVDGIGKLKSGVGSKLPTALPHKQIVALGCAGLALVVCMGVGIHMLFKMTGSNVKATPGVLVQTVAPPPDMYVD